MTKLDSDENSTLPKTTWLTELRAGCTMFVTMAYILMLVPTLLVGEHGSTDLLSQLISATALTTAASCLIMGRFANYPFALAPGLGICAYISIVVVGTGQLDWDAAFNAVFLSGLLLLAVTWLGWRDLLVAAIPQNLKIATGVGIGLFLAVVGLRNGNLIVVDAVSSWNLGSLADPNVHIAIVAIIVSAGLLLAKVSGALALGILTASLVGVLSGWSVYNDSPFAGFAGSPLRWPILPSDLTAFSRSWNLTTVLLMPVITMTFISLFDTAGALIALGQQGGFMSADGTLPRIRRAFSADAIGTTLGGVLGMTPVTCCLESTAGLQEGGRRGLSSMIAGVLFLGFLVVWPLVMAIPVAASAGPLLVIGGLMASSARSLPWRQPVVLIPALATIIVMPVTFSILGGIAIGLGSHVLLAIVFDRTWPTPILLGATILANLHWFIS